MSDSTPATYTKDEIRQHRLAFIEALESGTYQQGRLRLRSGDESTFCCLGVACEVALQSGCPVTYSKAHADLPARYGDRAGMLPDEVQAWLGCPEDPKLEVRGEVTTATHHNDLLGCSFTEIAQGFRDLWNLPAPSSTT